MFKLSPRNIADHKGRFVMTALAVILGVSFVVSSFVLSDTIRATGWPIEWQDAEPLAKAA